jgi:hypothetical protein
MDDSGGAIHEQSSWKAGRGLRADGGGHGAGEGCRRRVGGNTGAGTLNPEAAPSIHSLPQ